MFKSSDSRWDGMIEPTFKRERNSTRETFSKRHYLLLGEEINIFSLTTVNLDPKHNALESRMVSMTT